MTSVAAADVPNQTGRIASVPASAAAATSLGPAAPPIGACTIGTDKANSRVNLVWIVDGSSLGKMLRPDFTALQPNARLRTLGVGKYFHCGMEKWCEKLDHVTRYRIVGDNRNSANVRPLVGRAAVVWSIMSARIQCDELGEEPHIMFTGARVALINRHGRTDIIIAELVVPDQRDDISGVTGDNFHHVDGLQAWRAPHSRKILIALTTFQQAQLRDRQNKAEYFVKYLFYVGKSKLRYGA